SSAAGGGGERGASPRPGGGRGARGRGRRLPDRGGRGGGASGSGRAAAARRPRRGGLRQPLGGGRRGRCLRRNAGGAGFGLLRGDREDDGGGAAPGGSATRRGGRPRHRRCPDRDPAALPRGALTRVGLGTAPGMPLQGVGARGPTRAAPSSRRTGRSAPAALETNSA